MALIVSDPNKNMITFEEALQRILDRSEPLASVRRVVSDSLGYVIAEDLVAPEPMPRFDSSAVDGYGVRARDLGSAGNSRPVWLPLQPGPVAAGRPQLEPLQTGGAVRVFTGAQIPPGVDAVVMQEDVQVTPAPKGSVVGFLAPVGEGENIRPAGGEFRPGDLVLGSGSLVTPPVIGLLATFGIQEVAVYKKPSVSVIVTGDELVLACRRPAAGQIRDANSPGLMSAIASFGYGLERAAAVPDDQEALREELARALELSDVVVLSGGVSVGDFDFVKDVAAALGVETVFWRVAMKPGKPNFFGVSGRKLVFGVPGNPVAALVSFYLLVRPALARLSGVRNPLPTRLSAILDTRLTKTPGRAEFVRATLEPRDGQLIAAPLKGRDSHMLGALARADCLIHFPLESDHLAAGAAVQVVPLNWTLPGSEAR